MILDLAAGCAAVVWLYLIFGRGLFWRFRESREPEAEPGSSERPCDAILFGDEPASENGLNRRPAAGQWN